MSVKIIELKIDNIKRLKAVQIVPKGNTVVISGKNDQGKTSVLDSIEYAFRNGRDICDEPIRAGQKRASSFVRLSEELNGICTVEKRFTPSGTTLEIKNAEGIPQKNPQALLDAVMPKISFDPLSFVRMKKQEQYELLRKLVGLDFTELNKTRADQYAERTVRSRELEAAKAKLNGLVFNPALPKEPVSAVDIAQKLGDVRARNANNAQRRRAHSDQLIQVASLDKDIERLFSEIESIKKILDEKNQQLEKKRQSRFDSFAHCEREQVEIEKLENLDATALELELKNIQSVNSAIAGNAAHTAAQENVELLTGTVKALSDKIKECDTDKAAQIEFAEFPMPGLSFDEERGVLLNNVPFSQGSQARQLQAAVAIGLALNPLIKVILIRDASLLDADSLKAMSEQVEKADAQIWMEIVSSTDPTAITIEDGEIVSQPKP